MKYTEPRFTKDLDILIATDQNNALEVFQALKKFGAPLKHLKPEDFSREGFYYQMGNAPFRVDIMMGLPGIVFEEAWKNKEVVVLDETEIIFIGKQDLIQAKKTTARPQDLIDVENLENPNY